MHIIKSNGFECNYPNTKYELVFEDNFEGDTLNLENWILILADMVGGMQNYNIIQKVIM